MTTSRYQADVKVQIAWTAGFRVPMADWVWSDISDHVELAEGVSISGGRGDERSTADANTLTLTLDNKDGRFTADRAASPHYPNVKLYRPIRVLATPVDGSESVRFTGYVTSWPVEWDGTDAYAKATISASSRLSRLGLNAAWRSLIEETYLLDEPVVYYPLGEPEGSTMATDASGNGADPMVMVAAGTPVVFGDATGPGTDDLTAATFAGDLTGQHLWTDVGETSTPGDIWVSAFVNSSTSFGGALLYLESVTPDAGYFAVYLLGSGVARAEAFPNLSSGSVGFATGTTTVADGRTHHILGSVNWATQTVKLYVDGVLDASDSSMSPGAGWSLREMRVGQVDGVVAHVALGDAPISDARIAAQSDSGVTGWAGETTDVRLERYAAMAGIPAAEVDAEAGSTTMAHVDTTGANVVDLLRVTEATEAGVLFDDRDGTLTLHSRGHRYGAVSVLTLDMARQEVESDYSPRLDASALVNDITAANTRGVSAHVVDAASVEAYGVATASLSTASEDADEPLNLASWARYKYAEPRPRVPSLTVDALAQVDKNVTCARVMAVTVGDKVTVKNHPRQAALSSTDYFVEGYAETYGPERLTITWNLSPTLAEDQTFILDDPVRGDFDIYALPL